MIIELQNKDDKYISYLEKLFSNVFLNGDIKKEINNNPYLKIYIYLNDNNILGFIEIFQIYDRIEIANFNVLENYQNQHIGSKLLEYIINNAIDNQLKNITLEVRSDNEKAIYLYKKYGFENVSIRKNYYGKVDGILMKKDIIKEKDIYILGIESSCDETSFSIVKNGVEEIGTITSSQIDISNKITEYPNFSNIVSEKEKSFTPQLIDSTDIQDSSELKEKLADSLSQNVESTELNRLTQIIFSNKITESPNVIETSSTELSKVHLKSPPCTRPAYRTTLSLAVVASSAL